VKKKRTHLLTVAKYTIVVWAISVTLYGWNCVSRMLEASEAHPVAAGPYAEDLGFQLAAFFLTKGFLSLVLLAVVLLAESYFLGRRRPRDD
jgi:hypothetical protein